MSLSGVGGGGTWPGDRRCVSPFPSALYSTHCVYIETPGPVPKSSSESFLLSLPVARSASLGPEPGGGGRRPGLTLEEGDATATDDRRLSLSG